MKQAATAHPVPASQGHCSYPRDNRAQHDAAPPLRIGMLGLGTVGRGCWQVLVRNQALIQARSGRPLQLVRVAVRDLARARALVGDGLALTQDPQAVVCAQDVDVVVEVMGGTTTARTLVLQAIAHGKHVVTANKALLAEHGQEIFAAAQAHGVIVAYEGAVAVSIPIIKALREGLVANRIAWVAGIVNGTSNFILGQMHQRGLDFAAALQQAQALGYAEADPRFDVQGTDAAHKISLLAANAFGTSVPFAQVPTEGIEQIEALDMAYAQQLGYCIKLLAVAAREGQGMQVRVHPALLPSGHLLASVHGAMNAVLVKGDASGITMYYGAGAGSEPTASAVLADLVDVARTANAPVRARVPYLSVVPQAMRPLPLLAQTTGRRACYLRLASDASARTERTLLRLLARAGLQARMHGRYTQADRSVHHVLLTQPVTTPQLERALAQLAQCPALGGRPKAIWVETLG